MVILIFLFPATIARLISRITTATSSFTLGRPTPLIAPPPSMVMTTEVINRPEVWVAIRPTMVPTAP